MFSVIAHLTSLVFVVWTAYCIWLYVTCREGRLGNNLTGLLWGVLCSLTGLFLLMR